MGMLVWLLKPLMYALAFHLAAKRFKPYGLHSELPAWLVVVLATLARVALGFTFMLSLSFIGGINPNSGTSTLIWMAFITAPGFLWWLLVARGFFRKTPWPQLAGFALVAELCSGTVDYFALRELNEINFC